MARGPSGCYLDGTVDAPSQDAVSYSAPDRVLVVDDERNIRSMIRVCLEQAGCEVREASSAEAALAALASGPVDVAFVDLRLGTGNGLDLVPALLAEDSDLDVVVITAYASIDTAMEAVRRGARDYLPKPFTPAQIRAVVERLRERRRLRARVETLEDRLAGVDPDALLETRSAVMQAALSLLRRAAASDAAVLLRGENGTGKSVLARALHRLSPRAEKPFVTVSAPTLSDQLLVSELFGHARGSFTGAVRDAPGKVEAAEGGTLFLDEIGELGPSTQAQLLRFVQEKAFERVGETRTRHADVRIVSATNRELEEDVRAGRFREDLLYRLNVVEIRVPPLRDRREDILPMARRMLRFFAASLHRPRAAGGRRPVLAGADRARAHPAGDGHRTHAGRGSADPRHRRLHAVEEAQEVRRELGPAQADAFAPPTPICWSGSSIQNVAPAPGVLCTPARPPWASTTSRTMESPRPAPPGAEPGTR